MFVIEVEVQVGGQAWSVYVDAPTADAYDFAIAAARATLSTREARWARFVVA